MSTVPVLPLSPGKIKGDRSENVSRPENAQKLEIFAPIMLRAVSLSRLFVDRSSVVAVVGGVGVVGDDDMPLNCRFSGLSHVGPRVESPAVLHLVRHFPTVRVLV